MRTFIFTLDETKEDERCMIAYIDKTTKVANTEQQALERIIRGDMMSMREYLPPPPKYPIRGNIV